MKKLLAIAAMSFAASSAMAGVKLVVRSDYVNTPSYTAANGGDAPSTSLFQPEVARMYLSGAVGNATVDAEFNLRSFVVGTDATSGYQKYMTVDKFVETLTIAKPMGDWTFTAGKLWMNVGGYERHATRAGDTYLTSLANGGVGGHLLGGTTLTALGSDNAGAIVTPENMSGIAAAYNISADQKVEIQVANQTNSDSALVTAANKRHTMGVAYWGSFADKMVQTYLSYTSGAADTNTVGHEQTFLAAGVRLAPVENLGLDVEYLANSDKNASTSKKDEVTSTILEARYKMGMWVPVLKYEMSTDKAADVETFKRTGMALALEMVPKADDAFRYHIAYTSVADKDFAGNYAGLKDTTKNYITVGFKYTGDIVK
ncbi:MAG: hypothetical protein ACXVCY_18815 [Pseudobdellovibrionaceae bacterium]